MHSITKKNSDSVSGNAIKEIHASKAEKTLFAVKQDLSRTFIIFEFVSIYSCHIVKLDKRQEPWTYSKILRAVRIASIRRKMMPIDTS